MDPGTRRVRRHGVRRVGIEASGGYERAVVAHLQREGFAVAVLQPLQVKCYARFKGRRAKNDTLDAKLIADTLEARYGQISEEALAREHLERKRIRKPENEKEAARIMRRLVGAGFSTGVIYKILRQWEVPDETLAVLENLDEEPHED